MSTRRVVRVAAVFVGAVMFTLVLWAFVPMLWGWRPYVVTSGSMAPAVSVGDLILVDPARTSVPRIGDVITYHRPGSPRVTHRVVGRDADGAYRTKGDANAQADLQPVSPELVLGRVRIVVPMLGGPGLKLREHPAAAALLAGLIGVGWVALRRRRGTGAVGVVMVMLAVTAFSGGIAANQAGAVFVTETTSNMSAATRPQFYPLAILAAGPVSYWRLGETSGTNRADEMNVAPLTCSGAAGGLAGALSKDSNAATRLPTQSGYCRAASGSFLSMTGSFTIIVWERAIIWPQTSFGRLVAKYDSVAGKLNYLLAWDVLGTSMRAIIDTGSGRYTAIKSMQNDTNWHQIVMTWDGTNIRQYVDGGTAGGGPAPGTPLTTTTPTMLGYTAQSAVGDLDEVAIFARAIGAPEIATLYSLA